MTFKVSKSLEKEPGMCVPNTWEVWNEGTAGECVIFNCPRGQPILIHGSKEDHNWDISSDGKVTPSIWCRTGELPNCPPMCEGCRFHEFLELDGWDLGVRSQ